MPEVARARVARIREGGAWDSQLSVGEFAAISSAGFEPVGQVLGAAVFHIGFAGQSAYFPSAELEQSMYDARRLALRRAVAQCAALGGDGIVGVAFRVERFPAGGMEITTLGTAVRARSRIRPARPFTSHVTGQDFGKLVHAGWIPVEVVFGICIAVGPDAPREGSTGNREIDIYTQVVSEARRGAGDRLARDAKAHGGDGVVMHEMELVRREWEGLRTGRRGHQIETHYFIAEAIFAGTSIVSFGRPRDQVVQQPMSVIMLSKETTMNRENAAAPVPAFKGGSRS
jgi:uncharacterized protein YbjQ (UPF0145 family)